MAAYVPIDLHRHRSVVMHMADDGEVLGWTRLANDPETLVAEVRKAGEDPQVAIEATYGWYWAVDALQDAGLDVHLVAPSKVGAFDGRRVKNDQRDCQLLGDLLRAGMLRRRGSLRPKCASGASWSAIGPSWSGSAPG
jgi:transposase